VICLALESVVDLVTKKETVIIEENMNGRRIIRRELII